MAVASILFQPRGVGCQISTRMVGIDVTFGTAVRLDQRDLDYVGD
jgi:hypothetical protein